MGSQQTELQIPSIIGNTSIASKQTMTNAGRLQQIQNPKYAEVVAILVPKLVADSFNLQPEYS